MNTFFTSDEHYGHPNILKHSRRPFESVDEMNEGLIEAHNRKVGAHDIVYHVGDFAWKNHWQYIERLNGRHILIVGNHDKMSIESLAKFYQVHDMCRMKLNGRKIILCHFPMESWWNKGGGAWHLHGHTHRMVLRPMRRLYIGVDARRDMAPWAYEELAEILEELPAT